MRAVCTRGAWSKPRPSRDTASSSSPTAGRTARAKSTKTSGCAGGRSSCRNARSSAESVAASSAGTSPSGSMTVNERGTTWMPRPSLRPAASIISVMRAEEMWEFQIITRPPGETTAPSTSSRESSASPWPPRLSRVSSTASTRTMAGA